MTDTTDTKPAVTIRVRWRPNTVAGHHWADEWMNEFSLNPRVNRALTDDEMEAYWKWQTHTTEGEVVEVQPSADVAEDDLLIVKLVHLADGVAGMRRVAYTRLVVFGDEDGAKPFRELGDQTTLLPHPSLAAAWRAWEAVNKR